MALGPPFVFRGHDSSIALHVQDLVLGRISKRNAAKRVAETWLRLALSQVEFNRLKHQIPEQSLPFGQLFGDKKRLVIPAPDLKPEFSEDSRDTIVRKLKELGRLDEDEEIAWDEGMVVGPDGRKTRLGKRITQAQEKFAHAHPDIMKGLRNRFKTTRNRSKATDSYRRYVSGPLMALLSQWSEAAPGGYSLADIRQTVREVQGLDEEKHSLDDVVMKQLPGKIPHLGFKAQEIWLRAMGELLSTPEDIVQKLQKKQEDIERQREEISDKAHEIADRLREDRSENPREDKEALTRSNRERDRLLAKLWHARVAEEAFSNWPLEHRQALAKSIHRASKELLEAIEKNEESLEEYKGLIQDLPEEETSKLNAIGHLERELHNFEQWKGQGKNLSLVLSRSPVDVLRMSDHPTAPQSINSCHSEGKSHFQCAIDEAQGTGLVAYVVDNHDLESIDPEADEIFEDRDRQVKGIRPFARIRLRRFQHENGSDLAVPEQTVYGTQYPDLVDFVTDWARKEQPEVFEAKPRLSEYALTGGTYRDTSDADLFNSFFDTPGRETGNTEHKKKKEKSESESAPAKGSSPEEFWSWMQQSYSEVPNPNPDGRQDRISPRTLREYAEGGEHQQRAQQMIEQYLNTYRGQRTGSQRVAVSWLVECLRLTTPPEYRGATIASMR